VDNYASLQSSYGILKGCRKRRLLLFKTALKHLSSSLALLGQIAEHSFCLRPSSHSVAVFPVSLGSLRSRLNQEGVAYASVGIFST